MLRISPPRAAKPLTNLYPLLGMKALLDELSSQVALQPPDNHSSQISSNSKSSTKYIPEHSRGEPLIQVCSVHVFNKSLFSIQDEECQVYGDIHVVDDMDASNICSLYDKAHGDNGLDIISFTHSKLRLTGPQKVIAMKKPVIFVDIKDNVTGKVIIKGSFPMQNATTDVFEVEHTITIYGYFGTAEVNYIALRFGVGAIVEIFPSGCSGDSDSDSDDGEGNLQVYGSITAHYNHAYYGRTGFVSTENSPFITLLDTRATESQALSPWDSPNLCTSVVAVPAYSSLTFDFDLKDSDTDEPILIDKAVAHAIQYGQAEDYPICQTYPELKFCVRVTWGLSFMLDRTAYDQERAGCYGLKTLPGERMLAGYPLLEIFSVIIGRQDDVELRLYGSIYVSGVVPECEIFMATKKDPFILPSGCKTLPLRFPNCTMGATRDRFCIFVDLRDIDDRVFIQGYGNSAIGINRGYRSWFDRQLCSVIKDDYGNGFAAVNHTVLTRGIMCALKIEFASEGMPPTCLGLYGKIVSSCSKLEYTEEDEKTYCRCVLFERSERSCLTPRRDNVQLKLSRTAVSVSYDSSLLIEVDLKLRSPVSIDHVHQTIEFIPGEETSFVVCGSNFAIGVSVEWSEAPH